MIPIALIKQFASQDKTRPALLEPVLDGGMIVATNGRVLVEIPINEVDVAPEELPAKWAFFPAYEPMINSVFSALAMSRDACAISFQLSGKAEDHMVAHECADCGGTGEFSEPGDCWECDGKGKWEECEWTVEYPGGSWVNGLFAQQIMRMPGLSWYLPATPVSVIPFTFGRCGRGLLMPLRASSVVTR
jgi:hypothetical protein